VTATVKVNAPTLMPLLRYRDIAGAIEWLNWAFGFERGSVVTADDGAILYAQLILGNAMVLVEPVHDQTAQATPTKSGGESQSCYIVVTDVDDHYARARAAGVEIVIDLDDFDQGGRGYSCRDAEGHVWSFGTYDPWHDQAQAPHEPQPFAASTARSRARWAFLSASIVASTVAVAWIGATALRAPTTAATSVPAPIAAGELVRERVARKIAERAAREAEARASEQINAQEKSAKEAARAAEEAAATLASEQTARAAAEKAADKARAELNRERSAKEAAERAAGELKTQLARRISETQAASQQASSTSTPKETLAARDAETAELQERLAQERFARETAERAKNEAEHGLDSERSAAAGLKEQLTKERSAKAAAERKSQEALQQLSRERASKEQAQITITQLRKQLARAQAVASGDDYAADAFAEPSVSSNRKKGDPQYNGALSPF
jgi:uncharacterized glyoxalase superfamily protein PhnB